MKILDLVLKKQWFDLIKNGNKREEYREIKSYWTKRLMNSDNTFKNYTHVKFRCGYSNNFIIYRIESIEIGEGKEEWGAALNKQYYKIKFANRSLKEEFNGLVNWILKNNKEYIYENGILNKNIFCYIWINNIRALFSDKDMNFDIIEKDEEISLQSKDEHTGKLIKMIE